MTGYQRWRLSVVTVVAGRCEKLDDARAIAINCEMFATPQEIYTLVPISSSGEAVSATRSIRLYCLKYPQSWGWRGFLKRELLD